MYLRLEESKLLGRQRYRRQTTLPVTVYFVVGREERLTFALVQTECNLPVASDFSKISWISTHSSLSTTGLISPGPAALSGRKFKRSLMIQFRFKSISGIWGYLHLNFSEMF